MHHGLLVDDAKSIVAEVARKTTALANLADPVAADIRSDLLMSAQGELVSELQTFLDECYFEVLMQVLNEGNPSRLRLGKFKASLNLSYLPADDGEGEIRDRADVAQWFTLKGLIGDIWQSFKFESFSSQTQMILNACEYKIANDIRLQVAKHVQLRNCIQHHSRVITEDALRIAGVKEFVMKAGYIDRRVWESWYRGMNVFFKHPRIQALWEQDCKADSYYGFRPPP